VDILWTDFQIGGRIAVNVLIMFSIEGESMPAFGNLFFTMASGRAGGYLLLAPLLRERRPD